MSNLNRHPVRRAAVGVLAGTLAFTGGAIAAGASPANAVEGFTFERLAGADRFGTARDIANDTFQTANTVVLASGRADDLRTARNESNFPDALTGNYLAGAVQGPILLTAPNQLPPATVQALTQLSAKRVIIVGGTAAVSAEVEADLERRGFTVDRLGGQDRYDTAKLVAEAVVTRFGQTAVGESGNGQRTAVLGNGQNFPDILAAGPLGFAERFPITITPNTRSTLDPRTEQVLNNLNIERVLIVGGNAAVQPGVEAQLRAKGIATERLAGVARFETAVEIAEFAYDELGFDESHINLARSNDFADALAGGPHAGRDRAAIVLTDPTVLNRPTREFLERQCPTLTNGHIFGGPAAVSQAVENAAVQAASSCGRPFQPQPNTIDVQPSDSATATVTANPDTTTVDDRTFTVDGLFDGETYRITLVRCENVRTDSSGNVTFLAEAAEGSSTGFAAATGNPTADIISVNGVRTTDATTTAGFQSPTVTFVADGTSANFTIDGDEANECVVPVVYFDSTTANSNKGGSITRLEVQGPAGSFGAPAEDVDVGGQTNFVAATQPPARDTTPATVTAATAFDAPGSDTLTVTFDEAVQGVGTFLLRDAATGELLGEFDVAGLSSDSRTVTLVAADGTTVDFAEGDARNFVLQILNERDRAGNQTNATVAIDERGTVDADREPAPTITEARVVADAGTTGSDTATATVGDIFELTFSEAVDTATVTITLSDEDGDTFTVECNDGTVVPRDETTSATCELTTDRTVLTITLTEDAQTTSGRSAEFPLTIQDITGVTDNQGNDVNLEGSSDVVLEIDSATVSA